MPHRNTSRVECPVYFIWIRFHFILISVAFVSLCIPGQVVNKQSIEFSATFKDTFIILKMRKHFMMITNWAGSSSWRRRWVEGRAGRRPQWRGSESSSPDCWLTGWLLWPGCLTSLHLSYGTAYRNLFTSVLPVLLPGIFLRCYLQGRESSVQCLVA